jgi:hypothetical protein
MRGMNKLLMDSEARFLMSVSFYTFTFQQPIKSLSGLEFVTLPVFISRGLLNPVLQRAIKLGVEVSRHLNLVCVKVKPFLSMRIRDSVLQ